MKIKTECRIIRWFLIFSMKKKYQAKEKIFISMAKKSISLQPFL